jgi:hypothetical protein
MYRGCSRQAISGRLATLAFPLRNFPFCSECGVPFTGEASRGRMGKLYDYYTCPNCHAVKSAPTSKARAQFLELLGWLRVSELFTTDFDGILKLEWTARTHDTPEVGRRLDSELAEARAKLDDLLENRNDPRIAPHFKGLYLKHEDVIANVKARIAENKMEKATFEQLRSFSESLLANIPKAWEMGDIVQQRQVQSILFPEGLKHHPEWGF